MVHNIYIVFFLDRASAMILQAAQYISNGSTSSQAQGLGANIYLTWLLPLTWLIGSGAGRHQTTQG